jgi:streptogramin lyase
VLSVQGDLVAADGSSIGVAGGPIRAGQSRVFRLVFALPSAEVPQATLFDARTGDVVPLTRQPELAPRAPAYAPSTASTSPYRSKTFHVARGAGEPWGMASDRSGNIWFAEPGCDFAPRCDRRAQPGQIGELKRGSPRVALYTLPRIPGNQPIFVAFDNRGKLWFTTPDNSRIGEFDPSTRRFVGQWSVRPGTGPWDLTFANGRIWYTEHFGAAVGSFNPATHRHRDFRTPSANSEPYGIAANDGRIWFTENNSSVDRVAVLDTRRHDAIREYPIVIPQSGTPHMITIGPGGHPWWTEGFSATIATLDPAAATPGSCGSTSGTCRGVRRFSLPPSTGCSLGSHASGIVFDRSRNLVWLDDSLTSQIGSFNPSSGTFRLTKLGYCNAHPHDGLILADAGKVWFDEEFANGIGELVP